MVVVIVVAAGRAKKAADVRWESPRVGPIEASFYSTIAGEPFLLRATRMEMTRQC